MLYNVNRFEQKMRYVNADIAQTFLALKFFTAYEKIAEKF